MYFSINRDYKLAKKKKKLIMNLRLCAYVYRGLELILIELK